MAAIPLTASGLDMTNEERIARLEVLWPELKEDIKSIDAKVDRLIEAAHMGRGAWWLLLRLGAMLVAIAGVAGWLFDKVHKG